MSISPIWHHCINDMSKQVTTDGHLNETPKSSEKPPESSDTSLGNKPDHEKCGDDKVRTGTHEWETLNS